MQSLADQSMNESCNQPWNESATVGRLKIHDASLPPGENVDPRWATGFDVSLVPPEDRRWPTLRLFDQYPLVKITPTDEPKEGVTVDPNAIIVRTSFFIDTGTKLTDAQKYPFAQLKALLEHEKKILEQMMRRAEKFTSMKEDVKKKVEEWEAEHEQKMPTYRGYLEQLIAIPDPEEIISQEGATGAIQQRILYNIVYNINNVANSSMVQLSMQITLASEIDTAMSKLKVSCSKLIRNIDNWLTSLAQHNTRRHRLKKRWALVKEEYAKIVENRLDDAESEKESAAPINTAQLQEVINTVDERLSKLETTVGQIAQQDGSSLGVITESPERSYQEQCDRMKMGTFGGPPPTGQAEQRRPDLSQAQKQGFYLPGSGPSPNVQGQPQQSRPDSPQTQVQRQIFGFQPPQTLQCEPQQSRPGTPQPQRQMQLSSRQPPPYIPEKFPTGEAYFGIPLSPPQAEEKSFRAAPPTPSTPVTPADGRPQRSRAPPGQFPVDIIDVPGIGFPIPLAALEKEGRQRDQCIPLTPPQPEPPQYGRFAPVAASSPRGSLRCPEDYFQPPPAHPQAGQPLDPALLPKIQEDLQRLSRKNKNLQELVTNFKNMRHLLVNEMEKAVKLNQKLQQDLYYVAQEAAKQPPHQ